MALRNFCERQAVQLCQALLSSSTATVAEMAAVNRFFPYLQGLHKLSEPRALVRCRQVDQKLVEQAISAAQVGGN